MSDHRQPVFLYRIAPAKATQLRDLLAALFPKGGWAYGGAAIWDAVKQGAANLRPIDQFDAPEAMDVSGDFGQAFNVERELRWKRIDKEHYDLLVLSEQPVEHHALVSLEHRLGWRPDDPDDRFAALQGKGHPSLRFRSYRGPNGGVVLVRYTGTEVEKR
ncbi:MAG TPA: hypothetical protein VFS21_05600 [Roseiflexaceae bacterium]|nr:hypothetical protein [Roseiflexaceae bacterium]